MYKRLLCMSVFSLAAQPEPISLYRDTAKGAAIWAGFLAGGAYLTHKLAGDNYMAKIIGVGIAHAVGTYAGLSYITPRSPYARLGKLMEEYDQICKDPLFVVVQDYINKCKSSEEYFALLAAHYAPKRPCTELITDMEKMRARMETFLLEAHTLNMFFTFDDPIQWNDQEAYIRLTFTREKKSDSGKIVRELISPDECIDEVQEVIKKYDEIYEDTISFFNDVLYDTVVKP